MAPTGRRRRPRGADDPPAAGREPWLRMGLAADLASVGAARHTVGRFLEAAAVPEDEAHSVMLVTSELCTNAVEASTGQGGAEVEVACRLSGGTVEVEVSNRGDRFEPVRRLPPPEAEHGRGLYIVDALTDRLVVRHRGGRTTVIATRCLAGREARGRARPAVDPAEGERPARGARGVAADAVTARPPAPTGATGGEAGGAVCGPGRSSRRSRPAARPARQPVEGDR